MHVEIERITHAIEARSTDTRAAYEARMCAAASAGVARQKLACGNLAHGFAACGAEDKAALAGSAKRNVGIVTAYNDMLSAHQPYQRFPELIKAAARAQGGTAQVAGGVPAMCDGITQGQVGMELSLLSREVIAMSTAIALSHAMFDGAMCLGICDKIVPGLLIGALSFGHLPVVFVPSGPMPSGLPNKEKLRVREAYARGEVGREELLASEAASYHAPGTCTFYGTANSNQMLVEIMGLQLPGSSFVTPNTPLRDALTDEATRIALSPETPPLWQIITAKTLVNGIIGLLATGGSTNHTLHLLAIGRAAGVLLEWEDIDALSRITPLLTRIYPNGEADINHFHAAGGMGCLIAQLLDAGLLWEDVHTVAGQGLKRYRQEPILAEGSPPRSLTLAAPPQGGGSSSSSPPLEGGRASHRDAGGRDLVWREAAKTSLDATVLASTAHPFQPEGGLVLLSGNLGRAIFKTSAVAEKLWQVEAPARVFTTQEAVLEAFQKGELARDGVIVLTHQGPRANGMPELHALMPALGSLVSAGHKIALVTDGRLSGASGKVPAAIHVTPEAANGGMLASVRDGDLVRVDAVAGALSTTPDLASRAASPQPVVPTYGMGRELFTALRGSMARADQGA
jgi:phosphogluconate dehydratase